MIYFGSGLESDSDHSLLVTRTAQIENIRTAINGPVGYKRNLTNIIFNKKFLNKLDLERRNRGDYGAIAESRAILQQLAAHLQNESSDKLAKMIHSSEIIEKSSKSNCFIFATGHFENQNFQVQDLNELNQDENRKVKSIIEIMSREETLAILNDTDRDAFLEAEAEELRAAEQKAIDEAERLEREAKEAREANEAKERAEKIETIPVFYYTILFILIPFPEGTSSRRK